MCLEDVLLCPRLSCVNMGSRAEPGGTEEISGTRFFFTVLCDGFIFFGIVVKNNYKFYANQKYSNKNYFILDQRGLPKAFVCSIIAYRTCKSE